MELNVGLLRKVVEHIEAEPDTFCMEQWWSDNIQKAIDVQEFEEDNGRRLATCGTAGCIAGWTVQLGGRKPWEADSVEREASELLGLTTVKDPYVSYDLFMPTGTRNVSGYSIADLDADPTLVRDHVEKTLGVTL